LATAAQKTEATGVEAALAGSPLFRGLSPAALTKMARSGSALPLTRGQLLFSRGDEGDAMFVVVEGEVEIRAASEGGKEVRITALGQGAVIGEMAVLDGGTRSADIVATRRTRLIRISRGAVLDALTAEPQALLVLVAEIVKRLRATNEALEDSSVLDLGGRLAQLLLKEGNNGAHAVTLTQSEMARRIDASREKTNRKLQSWKETGWLKIDRSGVRILKPEALRALITDQRGA
jgi:CRP/FNR family transcriptional regulator, cyclic AMP receptor protein